MGMHFNRAQVLFEHLRYKQAAQEWLAELADVPECPLSHANLAHCFVELGAYDEARRAAERAVQLAPGEAYAHNALAKAMYCGGDHAAALAANGESLRIAPLNPNYLGLKARIELARAEHVAALGTAEAGLAIDPRHRACVELRAWALYQLGRDAEAVDATHRGLASHPDDASLLQVLGWIQLRQQRPHDAEASFREALRIVPRDPAPREGLLLSIQATYPTLAFSRRLMEAVGSLVFRRFKNSRQLQSATNSNALAASDGVSKFTVWELIFFLPLLPFAIVMYLALSPIKAWLLGFMLVIQSLLSLRLLFTPNHRRLLSAVERRAAVSAGVCIIVILALLGLGAIRQSSFGLWPSMVAVILAPTVVTIVRFAGPIWQWPLALTTGLLALVGLWSPVSEIIKRRTDDVATSSNYGNFVGLAIVYLLSQFVFYGALYGACSSSVDEV